VQLGEHRLGDVARRQADAHAAVVEILRIMDEEVPPARGHRLARVREAVLGHLAELGRGRRLHPHAAAVGSEQRERQGVVRDDFLDHRRHAQEDLAHVQRLGDRGQQRLELLAAPAALLLELQQARVLDRELFALAHGVMPAV
jgi:hypothetical protein